MRRRLAPRSRRASKRNDGVSGTSGPPRTRVLRSYPLERSPFRCFPEGHASAAAVDARASPGALSPRMAEPRFTRRVAIGGAASAAAGLAGAVAVPAAAVGGVERRRTLVPPVPIPRGMGVAPGQVIHGGAPGASDVTLPFSGGTLQGLDTEPTTIRDFNGFAAVAFHVGTATGSDGTRYDLETDLRTFQGTYIDRTGHRRFGTFGFI